MRNKLLPSYWQFYLPTMSLLLLRDRFSTQVIKFFKVLPKFEVNVLPISTTIVSVLQNACSSFKNYVAVKLIPSYSIQTTRLIFSVFISVSNIFHKESHIIFWCYIYLYISSKKYIAYFYCLIKVLYKKICMKD